MYPNDDTCVTTRTVTDAEIEQMNADLMDVRRNNAEPTEPELEQMAADAQITVRTRPMFIDLTSPRTDALGQIPPESAADLLEMVDDETGCSHLWHVDTEGRVFVARVINAGEAHKLGSLVARHLESVCGVGTDVRIDHEPAGEPNLWRLFVVTANGRTKLDQVWHGTSAQVAQWAAEFRLSYCPTIAPVAVEVAVKSEGKAA